MPRLKRTRDEAELDIPTQEEMAPQDRDVLSKLRNMWEFASLMQYIFLFGEVVKSDNDLDIEDLETECLMPTPSDKLTEIGLGLLKFVSSHRGLNLEIFEEYTRRQYLAKAPQRNPFGDDEEPTKFNALDIFTRVRILQQLSTWTLGNVDRIRGLMGQDDDNTNWRMEPLGWDKGDRAYYVLDDNRLYRRADEPIPPPTPKAKSKSKSRRTPKGRSRATRASKRRKIEESSEDEDDEPIHNVHGDSEDTPTKSGLDEDEPGFGFTCKTWECVAVTLDDYQEFMSTIFRSRDPNEKQLRARLDEDVVPVIEKRAEAVKQKHLRKVRELESLQKMATAKRSSRLAGKAEKEKQEREQRELEDRQQRELNMAIEEQERQRRIEEGHESRRLTREQRVRERESKRILHEQELARLEKDAERAESEDADSGSADSGKRISSRQLLTQQAQHRLELERLAEEDSKWTFDCSLCGVHGENLDDGTHSIACDRCNVWQHSKCHGLTKQQAERDDFHFICASCKQKEQDEKRPKVPPLKLGKGHSADGESGRPDGLPDYVQRQLDSVHAASHTDLRAAGPFGQLTQQTPIKHESGLASSLQQAQSDRRLPPVGNFAPSAPRHINQSPSKSSAKSDWLPSSHQALPRSSQHQNIQQRTDQSVQVPQPGHASVPPAHTNGHSVPSSQQYQQHQTVHQNAVASSSGHVGPHSRQPASESANVHALPSTGVNNTSQLSRPEYFPTLPLPPLQQKGEQQLQINIQNGSVENRQLAHDRDRNEARVNGQISPHLQHSPITRLQPPSASPRPTSSQSPTKATSPPHQVQQGIAQPGSSFHSSLPPLLSTPQQSMQSSFGSSDYGTPSGLGRPSSSSSKLAADGMAGPWPESSRVIPQKQDQSPVPPPPPSSQGIDQSKIIPPGAPLFPSPSQHSGGQMGTIPVKKIPEIMNGIQGDERSPTNGVHAVL